MGSSQSHLVNAPVNGAQHAQRTLPPMLGEASPFDCSSHDGPIGFDESWLFCDTCEKLHCQRCAEIGNISDAHPNTLVECTFLRPGRNMGPFPITCAACTRQLASSVPEGIMKCLEHSFTVCKECLMQPRGKAAMREHRLGLHNRGKPLSWVLYTITKAENGINIRRNQILNRPNGPTGVPVIPGGGIGFGVSSSWGQGVQNQRFNGFNPVTSPDAWATREEDLRRWF